MSHDDDDADDDDVDDSDYNNNYYYTHSNTKRCNSRFCIVYSLHPTLSSNSCSGSAKITEYQFSKAVQRDGSAIHFGKVEIPFMCFSQTF